MKLDGVQVFKDFLIKQGQPVADAEIVLSERKTRLRLRWVSHDRELGPAYLLAAEQVADSIDGPELEVEIGLEVESHLLVPSDT